MGSIAGASDNLSAVLYKKDDLRLEQTPLPAKPGTNEVILETLCVGICGSDVHYWEIGHIGDFVVTTPFILGHETCARVVEIGHGVNHLTPGDRVAIEPGITCRACSYCKDGRYNLCDGGIFFHATPPDNGTLTRYFKHPADLCFKLPDHVSDEMGAFLEPLSVGVESCRKAKISFGTKVLICGAGPIGLVNVMVAKAFGAIKICVTDINADRLKMAKEVGATDIVHVSKEITVDETVSTIKNLMEGHVDVTIECSGAPSSQRTAIYATKTGGRVVLVGHGPNEVTLPIASAAIREVDLIGSFRYKNTWPMALSLVASGRVNPMPLITHRYKLEQAIEAFEKAKSGTAVKVMIRCEKE